MTRTRRGGRPRLRGVFGLVAFGFALSLSGEAAAGPPYLKFLQGLRDRRYDDTAVEYLDRLEADPSVPADVKDVLDYERAVTLIGMSKTGSDPGLQAKRLDEATAALEKFVAGHPGHPLIARAQTERGKILLGRAKVAILQADAPGNESRAEQLRGDARTAVAKARDIFEEARRGYEAQLKAFGPFVEADDPTKKEARDQVATALAQCRIHLADCTYREAQSYAAGVTRRNELLGAAASQYEVIHDDYRTWIAGLYCKLMRAKCFEEQTPQSEDGKDLAAEAAKDARQKLNIAESIYSELLAHNTQGNAEAARLQEIAFWFKLIVRNHPVLADHQLVVDQATEWLKTRNGSAAQTPAALGVRWERARAAEALTLRRDFPEADRGRLSRLALDDAEFVNSFPSDFRDVSRAMIGRAKAALGKKTVDPSDFDEANGLASTLHNQIGEKQAAVKSAKSPGDKVAAEQALAAHLDETARVLRLALTFAGPDDDRQAVNRVRYLLAHVEYGRDRNYDAAVIAGYVARKFKDQSAALALDSAYLAMAAYFRLYARADGPKDFELAKLRAAADFVATEFPESEQANEARTTLGRVLLQSGEYASAADAFSKVPEASPQALEARLLAGGAFWEGYAAVLARPAADRPDQQTIDALRADAERFLRGGLALAARQIPADAVLPDDAVAAKVTLAQIANLAGNHQEAVDLLTGSAHPVVGLVAAEANERPKTGIKRPAFASLVHQQLLRAYIGLQQVDPAVAEMKALEEIGGEGNTAVFVQLGRQIKAELDGLPEGPSRDSVMAAFDQFLGNLAKMRQGQTYGSLLWIGETYFGLAEAAAEPQRSAYFDRAAESYDAILGRANEPDFLPSPDAAHGVRLRLAAVESSRGEFGRAYDLARQVLKASPKALNAQIEAASILRDWGLSVGPESPEKLLASVQGDPTDKAAPVWGWNQIARKLQQSIAVAADKDELEESLRRARFEIPSIRRAYAKTRPDAKQKDAELDRAEKELLAYVATSPKEEIGDAWWPRFDALYADIQRDRGVTVVKPLQPAKRYAAPADPPKAVRTAAGPKAPSRADATTRAEGSGSLPYLFGGLVVVAAVGGAAYATLKGNAKTRPRVTELAGGAFEPPAFSGIGGSAARPARPPKPAAARPSTTPAAAPTAAPAGPRPASRPAGTPRPRPAAGGPAPERLPRPAARPDDTQP